MKIYVLLISFLFANVCFGQTSYDDSMKTYIKNYVQNHEVVKGHDKEHMQFYEVNKAHRVTADYKPASSASWITFKTSGIKTKVFKLYGTLSFTLQHKHHTLNIYQSQELMASTEHENYLFLPFTDSTTGKETYLSGRYIDLTTTDIKNGKVVLDFNKAYNPYCAYVSGVYNCPIPPKENTLGAYIRAGEKSFTSSH